MPTNAGVTSHTLAASYVNCLQAAMPAGMDVWNISAGTPLTFTYKFVTEQPAYADAFSGWTPFSDAQKAAVVSALAEYASFINVRFVETTGPGANLSLGRVTLNGGEGGVGGYRCSYLTNSLGQVTSRTLNSYAVFNRSDAVIPPNTILHELGHALTLKHPGAYDAGAALAPAPYLPASLDNNRYSVMSYRADPDNNAKSDHLMLFDIAALQARFGANLHFHTGNNVYTGPSGNVQVIWDAGGTDMIDGSAYASGVRVNLNDGSFSSLRGLNNLAIAYRVVIEIAKGGAANDRLIGNGFDNLLAGGAGADTIFGKSGNDRLVGGPGADRFVFDTRLNPVINVDTVRDFTHGVDKIVLAHAVFTTVARGELPANEFFRGAAAHDANDHFIYNPGTGWLTYDANGSLAGGAVHFAHLAAGLAVSAADFLIV
jgi:hypothetical protein